MLLYYIVVYTWQPSGRRCRSRTLAFGSPQGSGFNKGYLKQIIISPGQTDSASYLRVVFSSSSSFLVQQQSLALLKHIFFSIFISDKVLSACLERANNFKNLPNPFD